MKISGFTFAYNAIEGGYPIIESVRAVQPYVSEVVAVDIESTDNTRDALTRLGCRVIDGKLNGTDTVNDAFKLHTACEGDVIVFFEADEVFDDLLLQEIVRTIGLGLWDIAIQRLQVEQNFQRIKEYPIFVHRIFPNGKGSYIQHPTNIPDIPMNFIPGNFGYLWDCSNCFRDNWLQRKANQAKLFGQSRPIYVPTHFTEHFEFWRPQDEMDLLAQSHWLATETPLALPDILRPLLGKTHYEANV